MKIVADENMPMVEAYFSDLGEIVRLPGRNLTAEDVVDADILLVRSVTKVNEALLRDSRVKFVGTATIGTDHLDIPWLEANDITWSAAPGCNAISVAEYVVSSVAALQLEKKIPLENPRAAVIGVGNVGSIVAAYLEKLGFEVMLNDPPRADRDPEFQSTDIKTCLAADLICFHAPLHHQKPWTSYHLLDEEHLDEIRDGAILLSAGRGEVIDFQALFKHLDRLTCCLDVWEPEPDVPLAVLEQVWGASPHVAGYAIQSKWRGTFMIYEAAMKHLSKQSMGEQAGPLDRYRLDLSQAKSWQDVVLSVYDPRDDTQRMKQTLLGHERPAVVFDQLRKQYPVRHELSYVDAYACSLPDKDVDLLKSLGLNLGDV